jgi:hypothetical protein
VWWESNENGQTISWLLLFEKAKLAEHFRVRAPIIIGESGRDRTPCKMNGP